MSPPTEQLIRDYLNRLSVAARDRLGPDDRRALVDRTRKLIERKADFAGRPTTMEVGKVLSRLGDPAVLVEQEWRRLAAVRRDLPAGTSGTAGPTGTQQPADPAESWEPAASAGAAEAGSGRGGLLARVLRREPGRTWRASMGWPTAVISENGAPHGSDAAPGGGPLKPEWPSVIARDGATVRYPRSDLPVRNGTIVGAEMATADTGPRAAEDGGAPATNGTSDASTTAAFETKTGDEPGTPARSEAVSRAVRLLGRLASAAWQQPLETTAIILLGPGGVIFPPVFVLGALIALGSRVWHYRDKWAGLVLPPLLTILGVAAAIAIGGRGNGLHDAWVSLNIVSRIAALLGAGYLAWRVGPGRRPPPAPPWHKPHRVT
jgi:hypothetical protein